MSLVFRFDDVEVREGEFSLTKAGRVSTVEPKAFRALVFLLRNPQRLISKEELIQWVWGDTAVGDGSLTRCIWLLRRLLADDINQPRYIETVATVGYRFVCPVDATVGPAPAVDVRIQSEVCDTPEVPHAVEKDVNKRLAKLGGRRLRFAFAAGGIVVVCAVLVAAWWFIPAPVPVVDSITQLTEHPGPKFNLVTDGSRVYFNEGLSSTISLESIAQVSIEGGPSVPLQTALSNPAITGVARDGSALIGITTNFISPYGPLWSIPLPAGEPRRLGNLVALSATILPNNRILYSTGKDVLTVENDGSNSRKLASLAGNVSNMVVSPDGDHVLLQVDTRGDLKYDTFQMHADGTGLREVRKANANECCFGWSGDGKYLVYSARNGKRWDLWAIPLRAGPLRRPEMPVRLTNGPLSFAQGGVPSRDGRQIFAIGSKERGQLVRYDMASRQFVPLLSGISATDATYSKDGNWVAYTLFPEHTLWRSRSDGSERMQLTYPPIEVFESVVSPDGTKIAFDSMGDHSVCVIDMDGGAPRTISASAISPKWSPDGNSVVYNRLKADGSHNGLEIAEVATGKKSEVPSPDGKLGAFWLDPQSIVAANGDLKKLMIFDFRTRTWTDLVAANLQNWINSPDGKYVYYAAGGPESSIQRIRVADRHVETVTSLKDFTRVSNFDAPQLRMTADGSPTLTRAVDSQEIYTLNVRWP